MSSTASRASTPQHAGVALLITRAVLDGIAGGVLLVAAVLLVVGNRARALGLASITLLLSLTVVNLVVFYLEQFVAAVGALVQLSLLQTVRGYQQRYLPTDGDGS